MNKTKELLEYVSQSIMSISNESRWAKPRDVSKIEYKHRLTSEEKLEGDITTFEIDIPQKDEMNFKYKIEISKIPYKSFWGNDVSKYVTKLSIYNRPTGYSYSQSHIETLTYLSWLDTDTAEIQKNIFKYLELKNIEQETEEKNKKFNGYIKDIKKTISVSVTRDNKLNDILEEENESQS
jgi:nicotinamidase-related amidase